MSREQLVEVLSASLQKLLATQSARAAGAPADPRRLAELLAEGLADTLAQATAADALVGSPAAATPAAEERIVRLLRAEPDRRYTLDDITEGTGLPPSTTAACVSALVQDGSVVRDGYFIRIPGPDDELPPRDWDPNEDERGGPDRRTGGPSRRTLTDRRLDDRRHA
jgi:hypothetical protein